MIEGFHHVYLRLRSLMIEKAPEMVLAKDSAESLELRTRALDTRTGLPGWFGTVTVRKSYVAFHLMALYEEPSLADNISPALAKRRQGKTCFNFVRIDETLLDELARLTGACAAYQNSAGNRMK